MKKVAPFMILLVALLGLTGCGDLGSFTGSLEVGDEGPAGGTIVYVDSQDEHDWDYIEVAPVDVTFPASPARENENRASWGLQDQIGDLPRDIGSGLANTERIMEVTAAQRSDLSRYAARLAREFEHGGSNDWFLPSAGELEQVYAAISDNGTFSPQSYWTSSEVNSVRAFVVGFGSPRGTAGEINKSSDARIRAVRYVRESDL